MSNFLIFGVFQMIFTQKVLNVIKAGFHRLWLIYFSESSHVAYQIKADDAGSNMVANILPTDTPMTQGWGQKVKLYLLLKVVILHIKLKGIEHRAP